MPQRFVYDNPRSQIARSAVPERRHRVLYSARHPNGVHMSLVGSDPAALFALILALGVGFTVHEFAHAWTAFQLGDDTAARQGRLTLDPRSHIDPLGAIMLLVAGFGWARPVPIDPIRLGRQGTVWVSLAGPFSNLILATIAAIPLRLFAGSLFLPEYVSGFLVPLLYSFARINILLAVFNMMPISPLDGWKVLIGLLPPAAAFKLQTYERYGFIVLILLFVTNSFWIIAGPPMRAIQYLILGPDPVG